MNVEYIDDESFDTPMALFDNDNILRIDRKQTINQFTNILESVITITDDTRSSKSGLYEVNIHYKRNIKPENGINDNIDTSIINLFIQRCFISKKKKIHT